MKRLRAVYNLKRERARESKPLNTFGWQRMKKIDEFLKYKENQQVVSQVY
jgi:hypothetical protein